MTVIDEERLRATTPLPLTAQEGDGLEVLDGTRTVMVIVTYDGNVVGSSSIVVLQWAQMARITPGWKR